MQTFMPYPDFNKTATVLDYRRLGKQRVEARQILNIIEQKRTKGGWVNHPAVKMWRGHEEALYQYLRVVILEWIRRGYVNNMDIPEKREIVKLPSWFGRDKLHASHRAALLKKDYKYYSNFGWTEKPEIKYWWPE